MKPAHIFSRLNLRKCCADLWFLGAVLCLTIPAQAQSSVTVKVETTKGAMISDVKVMAKHLDPKSTPESDPNSQMVIDVQEIPQTETAKYATERLRKGKYEFFACDDGLKYEPGYDFIQVGESDNKKMTLVLEEQLRTQPLVGVAAGSKVCLVHIHTECKATREVDSRGNIQYRGLQEHYHIEPQACTRK
jgi:hypothetical protein